MGSFCWGGRPWEALPKQAWSKYKDPNTRGIQNNAIWSESLPFSLSLSVTDVGVQVLHGVG